MKTTIEISDDLLRAAKQKALMEGRTLKELVDESLRRLLYQAPVDSSKSVERLKKGLNLGGKPLTRQDIYDG